jgi:DNA-binding transcriptional LysR family regulator
MEIREMRSFVVLAEELHFGKAARVLNLSQPALSKQILRLEEELGGSLLSRGRHGAQLTALGRQFLPRARSLVRDSDTLQAWTQRAARGEVGQLRLGFGFHTFELVPRLLVKLRRNLPEVEITLRDMSTAEQTDGLRSERIDIGFVRLPAPPDIETLPCISDRVSLVSRSGAGLPAQLSLADCKNEPFVLISRERSPTFYNHVLRLCANLGFHPRIVQEVPEATTALALVRAGLGLTLIGQSFGTSHFAGVKFHTLKDPEARWEVGAAWRKGDSNPVLHRFLSLLRREVKK